MPKVPRTAGSLAPRHQRVRLGEPPNVDLQPLAVIDFVGLVGPVGRAPTTTDYEDYCATMVLSPLTGQGIQHFRVTLSPTILGRWVGT